MPTLVWTRRPESGTNTDAVISDSDASAVPDQADSSGPALAAASSSKEHADRGKKKKRKINRAKAAAGGKKKSNSTFGRKLPRGVQKRSSGKFRSSIGWCGKYCSIGTFDTPKKASIAYESVKKDLSRAKPSALSTDEAIALFGAAKKKAVEAVGGFERDLPRGVYKLPTGKFRTRTKWGGKVRDIGTFDTPEQASAAYLSVTKDLEDPILSTLSGDGFNAAFDAAKTKALKTVGFKKEKSKANSERDFPKGVYKAYGKFVSQISWGGTTRRIGAFDTPELASAAYESMRKDLDDVNLSAIDGDEVNAAFEAAKKKAVEAVGGIVPEKRDLPQGVHKTSSGKFQSMTCWAGKTRHIGCFDTPKKASTAYMSVRKDLAGAKPSTLSADEANALFDAAKQKALETMGGFVPARRGLPRGVKKQFDRFTSSIWWCGKQRHLGTFDTAEQASAAFLSVKKALEGGKPSSTVGADEAATLFATAKKKALEAVQAMEVSEEYGDEFLV